MIDWSANVWFYGLNDVEQEQGSWFICVSWNACKLIATLNLLDDENDIVYLYIEVMF